MSTSKKMTSALDLTAMGDYAFVMSNPQGRVGRLHMAQFETTLIERIRDAQTLPIDTDLMTMLEPVAAYGIEFDITVSSPSCTRIGSAELHATLPVQSRMKGCLLDDDGNVTEYLNPSDWTDNVRDGSRGQVMVEIPQHYRKFVTNGNKRQVWFSEYPLPGYHQVVRKYISAYEASVQRSVSKLASVVNTTADYRGGNNNATHDGTHISLLGRPASNMTRAQFRTMARARKPGDTRWNLLTYEAYCDVVWLFVVEYATLNSQGAYNAQPTAQGYRQGGLGMGATKGINDTQWSEYCGYYPFIPCGYTDALGNSSGTIDYLAKDSGGNTLYTIPCCRYRGIENLWGHTFKHTDGLNIIVNADVANGGTGKSDVYVASHPSLYSDTHCNGYRHEGACARTSGYISRIIFGERGCFLGSHTQASSSTYMCDYLYNDIPTSGYSLRAVLLGGNAYAGTYGGLLCAAANYAPSHARAHCGSRLCFMP